MLSGSGGGVLSSALAPLQGRIEKLLSEHAAGKPWPVERVRVIPHRTRRMDEQFAVGSIVKLYILDELAAQVAAGKRRWSDVVPLSHQSFSSAGTANWPKDTPVTVQSLANWMISVRDNSATRS